MYVWTKPIAQWQRTATVTVWIGIEETGNHVHGLSFVQMPLLLIKGKCGMSLLVIIVIINRQFTAIWTVSSCEETI